MYQLLQMKRSNICRESLPSGHICWVTLSYKTVTMETSALTVTNWPHQVGISLLNTQM